MYNCVLNIFIWCISQVYHIYKCLILFHFTNGTYSLEHVRCFELTEGSQANRAELSACRLRANRYGARRAKRAEVFEQEKRETCSGCSEERT